MKKETTISTTQARRGFAAAVVVWAVVICAGTGAMLKYASTAGRRSQTAATWPIADVLPRASDRHTLIMTVHPQCPCSRASISELERLMSRCDGRLNAYVLFVEPGGLTGSSAETDLWKSAARIAGVTPIQDANGVRAERLGAETSGQAYLYNPAGSLLFSGGITGARGHAGDNDGRTAIEQIVLKSGPLGRETPVYGCALE
ncbi:MAG: RedB protein [Burkholderiales bacterium]|nr:RedB protein [Phycisphaerae bacterium]